MREEIVVLRVFDSELEAVLAQQTLGNSGIATFILKDDAGGMEPHLQRTIGVRLVLADGNIEKAQDILQAWDASA